MKPPPPAFIPSAPVYKSEMARFLRFRPAPKTSLLLGSRQLITNRLTSRTGVLGRLF